MAGTAAATARAIEPAEVRPQRTATGPARWGSRPALPRELAARLTSARELLRTRREERREPLATGVAALDRPLGGGLPRGELVELVGCWSGGRHSSGRFSTALAALAGVTAAGEAAALVDLGDGLEPAAAQALGADLERLLWLRPRTLREALAAAEAALNGGLPLVVLELGPPPLPGGRALRASGPAAAWTRLARAAHAHGAALLAATPYRLTGSAAAAVLEAAGRPAWSRAAGPRVGARGAPPLLAGLDTHVRVDRPLRGGAASVGDGEETLPLAAAGEPVKSSPTVTRAFSEATALNEADDPGRLRWQQAYARLKGACAGPQAPTRGRGPAPPLKEAGTPAGRGAGTAPLEES